MISLCACAVLLALAVVARLVVGGEGMVSWPEGMVASLRMQRAAAGAVVGAALAVSGVLLQCLLRNPLASPDLLGLASGAGFGVMVAMYLSFAAGGGIESASLAVTGPGALIGAGAALVLVFTLSQRAWRLEPATLILIGVVVSIIASAGTMLVRHLLPDRGVAASRWLMGAVSDDVTMVQLVVVGSVTLAVAAAAAWFGPAMDAATLGDDEAMSLGVPLARLRAFLFVGAGVLAAASVLLAGPVGFIGLVCPHAVRMAAGPAHRPLVIASAMAGAALVVAADALVKAIELPAGRLPIGVLTALVGGPVLIVLLRRTSARVGI